MLDGRFGSCSSSQSGSRDILFDKKSESPWRIPTQGLELAVLTPKVLPRIDPENRQVTA